MKPKVIPTKGIGYMEGRTMMVTCLIMKPSTCQPFETRTQMANEDKQNISMLIMFRASCRHSYLNICCFFVLLQLSWCRAAGITFSPIIARIIDPQRQEKHGNLRADLTSAMDGGYEAELCWRIRCNKVSLEFSWNISNFESNMQKHVLQKSWFTVHDGCLSMLIIHWLNWLVIFHAMMLVPPHGTTAKRPLESVGPVANAVVWLYLERNGSDW